MTQPARPRPTVPDYATTIIGALELSERKWVVAVQLPGLKRHSRHVLEARCDDLVAKLGFASIPLFPSIADEAIFCPRVRKRPCAPRARTISEGGSHLDNCRLV